MEKLPKVFWGSWYASDELHRVELVKTLTLPSRELEGEDYKHHSAVLINSYLTDLSEFMEGLESGARRK